MSLEQFGVRRRVQGTWVKTCIEPYALSLVPLFLNNVSASQYNVMYVVSQINQII